MAAKMKVGARPTYMTMAKAAHLQCDCQEWVCSSLEEGSGTLTGHQGGNCLTQVPKGPMLQPDSNGVQGLSCTHERDYVSREMTELGSSHSYNASLYLPRRWHSPLQLLL